MSPDKQQDCTYSRFACIGTGFAGIALGATLQRWHGIDDFRFFERNPQLGGTWFRSRYPGCACDIPSALYSYSFAPNPGWTQVLPSSDELWNYLKRVADDYSLPAKMTFRVEVEKCEWVEDTKRWRVHFRRLETDEVFLHECQFLFAATGQLVQPRELDVPGQEQFKGPIFHSSYWPSDLQLDDKRVVIFGNGCTAAQIVPAILDKARHVTQITRSKHWFLPAIGDASASVMQFLINYIPGGLKFLRFIIFLIAENGRRAFPMNESGARFRKMRQGQAEKYMRSEAPTKYHDLLIPNFEIGCRRRVFDSGYLRSLHSDKVTLVDERALEVVPNGVKTSNGIIEADVIIKATGYITNSFLPGIEVIGRGETLVEHWDSFGGPEAYNCSVVNGFPNFFMIFGPNSSTGHTSAIMAAENSVNYALRILRPILDDQLGVVEVKREAEQRYSDEMQRHLVGSVWNSGCSTYYVKKTNIPGKTWNAVGYPYSQPHFWYRSLFVTWSDWIISTDTEKPWSCWSFIQQRINMMLLLCGVLSSAVIYHVGRAYQLSTTSFGLAVLLCNLVIRVVTLGWLFE